MVLGLMMLLNMRLLLPALLRVRLWHAIIASQLTPPIYSISTNIPIATVNGNTVSCDPISSWFCTLVVMLLPSPSLLLLLDSMSTDRVRIPVVVLLVLLVLFVLPLVLLVLLVLLLLLLL
jgi:hypothetical protein